MIAFCDFSGPIFIRLLIEYLQQDDKPLNYGIIIGVCFSFLVFSNSIMKANNLWLSKKLEIRIKNAICNVIYGKVLIAANIPEGMGVNLLQVDAKKIFECLPKLSQWITCPLQVSLSIYLIAIQVGSAVYAAIGVLVICITLNYIIAEKLGKYSENIMNIRDKRIASSTQMFGNIKMIKAYCWEDYFKKIIHTVRKGELSFLRFLMFLYATAYFFYWAIPGFTAGSVFFYYSVIMQETLTTEKAFVTIMTLNILQDSLQDVPYLVSDFMMCLVSIKRIQSLLDVANLQSLPKGETIDLKKCTFSYGDKNVINEITLHIQKGEFVAIIGPVGSGKSTLLNSIMGELNFKTGSVSINDDLAYAPSLDS